MQPAPPVLHRLADSARPQRRVALRLLTFVSGAALIALASIALHIAWCWATFDATINFPMPGFHQPPPPPADYRVFVAAVYLLGPVALLGLYLMTRAVWRR